MCLTLSTSRNVDVILIASGICVSGNFMLPVANTNTARADFSSLGFPYCDTSAVVNRIHRSLRRDRSGRSIRLDTVHSFNEWRRFSQISALRANLEIAAYDMPAREHERVVGSDI